MAKLKLNNVEVITESGGTATLAPGINPEGTAIKSTGESGGSKFLREDGDGTSSWIAIEPGAPSITDNGNANAMTIAADESVTFNQFAQIPSLKPKSNQNLTGTYADHEMIMGDKFTLTGNLTINDNLVLASLSGSGQDIIIEDDGNGRTITTAGKVISCTTTNTDATVTTADTSDLRAGTGVTGTGVPAGATIASVTNATTFELSAAATASGTVNLTFDTAVFEAGEFLGTAGLPSLTDLSGELGTGVTMTSAVTGSPAINLTNVTHQVGGVIQIVFGSKVVSSGHSGVNSAMGGSITNPRPTHNQGITAGIQSFTPKYANSKILVQTNNILIYESSNVSDHMHLFLQDNSAATVLSHFAMYACINGDGSSHHGGVLCLNHVFDSWGTSPRQLEFRIGSDGGGNANFRWNPHYNSGPRNTTETGQFHWTLTEIAQ